MKANFRQPVYNAGEKEPFLVIGVEKDYHLNVEGTMGESWHEDLEITFNLARVAHYFLDGKEYYLTPGMFIVTNGGSLHGFIVDHEAEKELKEEDCIKIDGLGYEIGAMTLIISVEFMENNFPRYKEMFFTNECLYPSEETMNIFIQLCKSAKPRSEDPFIKVHRKALILDLIYHLCVEGQVIAKIEDDDASKKNLQRIKDIVSFIENNYSTQLTQEAVAKVFYFTPSYFSRYFNKYIGENFSDYLRKYRVSKARELLISTDLSVAEIASKCGFYDDRRFIIAFKKIHGDTPLQYKKKHISMQEHRYNTLNQQ